MKIYAETCVDMIKNLLFLSKDPLHRKVYKMMHGSKNEGQEYCYINSCHAGDIILKVIKKLAPWKFIDIGAGAGLLLELLMYNNSNPNYYGIEKEKEAKAYLYRDA